MINLIFENGDFSLKGEITTKLKETEDVVIDVIDDIPAHYRNRLAEYACEFLNRNYKKEYKVYAGDSCYTTNKTVSVVRQFNFRLSELK